MINFLRSMTHGVCALLLVIGFHVQARHTVTVNNKQITTGQVYELSALMDDRNSLDEFYAIVDSSRVFLDFYAPWCGPCKTMTPHFKELAQEADHVLFIKVNFDEFRELCISLGVRSLPTFISFDKGQEIARISKGAITKKELKKLSRIL